ncbi:AAA family ATPase [Bradyrhizobium sp. HKCCYLRH2060]|uniref:AAA family ATPase n=1 Tax=Bradyrhizobium sp. HKCCYLRH2060 TaxID=3420743 RepID=UPI003EBB2FDD
MVRRLKLLRNIGKFDNVVAGAQLPFSRLTVIYAENARGKTTLAAILRSLASGRTELITERARLGAVHLPHVVIDTGSGAPAVFQNGAWTRTAPEIVIFDDTFVAENVYSGMEVGVTHRQNLHELIVGSQGIALARALQAEVDKIEVHNAELREKESAIPARLRSGLSVDAFCALAPMPHLPQAIEEAERRLAAARDASRVAETPTLPQLSLPKVDLDALRELLAKSLPDLDASALERVQEHLSQLGRGGEAWVGEGMGFVGRLAEHGHGECPFCAQDLAGSPVLAHYRAHFGHAYKELKLLITEAARNFRAVQSGDVPAAFERSIRETVERQAFWKAFARVPAVGIDTVVIARTWKLARESVERLLEAKMSAPLEPMSVPAEVERAVAEHNANCDRIREVSDLLNAANTRLQTVKEQAREANEATLANDLANLRAVEARHDPAIAPLCDAYLAERAAKAATEQRRRVARTALDQHRQAAFPAYGVAINDFLQRFNANFRVGPVDAANTRGGSAANYTLLIDGNPVPLTADPGSPSFSNTLSAGDRNTLALAFFFASLQNDPLRAQRIVVIDDPMTSLDEHRTLHTLQEMDRLVRDVAGLVVLSHSKPFLLGVWDKCQQLQKVALEVRRSGAGSTLAAWNIYAAMMTEHDRRYAAAVEYLEQADPTIERRVAESLRPMMESFCRVAYPNIFTPGSMLGRFQDLCETRAGTPQEIMSATNAREFRALLDYANRFHHDTNTAYATELINDAELADFTQRTLAFIRRP